MTLHNNLIATDQDSLHTAGAISYWRLSSSVIEAERLITSLARLDVDENVPKLPSTKVALRRAVAPLARGNLFVRNGTDSILLVEQVDDDFQVVLTASVNIIGRVVVTVTDACNDYLVQVVQEAYTHALCNFSSTDISSWLIREATECDAISLRDTGGVYFIPKHRLDRWEKISACLHKASACRVHRIPAMSTDDAVDSILTALTEECTQFSAEMDAALADADLGARAMRGRADKADKMLAKLQRYEALLGDKMADIATQIQAQQANAIMVALTKEGE